MGLFGGDSGFNDAKKANAKNKELYAGIELPEYLTYSPEQYQTDSADYELTSDNPLLKSAQMAALAKMSGLAETGLSDADQAGYEKARMLGGQIAKQGNAAAMQNAQARGVAGSGLEFAMREAAGQDASTRAQEAGLQQAADAAKQRALYQQAYAQQLSGARDQDYRTNTQNAGIINQFNQANTNNRNNTNAANVDQRNAAFKYNEGLKDKRYANSIGQADRTSGFNNRDAEIAAADAAQRRAQSGAVVGTIGGVVGGIYGGPAGASAGYAAGNSLGSNMAHGGMVHGHAPVRGDSPKNDIVRANLSPGEVVVPRTVVQKGKSAIAEFADHVAAASKPGYADGGKIPEPSMWENIKKAFEEEKPQTKTPVKELDPEKARAFASVYKK